jgi:hypothetical protein
MRSAGGTATALSGHVLTEFHAHAEPWAWHPKKLKRLFRIGAGRDGTGSRRHDRHTKPIIRALAATVLVVMTRSVCSLAGMLERLTHP